MKNLIVMMALSGLFTLAFVDKTAAQIRLSEVAIRSSAQLPEKVTKAFQSNFPNAEAPRWSHPNRNYTVTFLMDAIKHNALFSKNGYLIYQISYGNERSIPADLREQVEENFLGYNLISAINVKQNGRNIWFLTGEGPKDFLNVRVEEGVMQQATRVRRYDAKAGNALAKGRD